MVFHPKLATGDCADLDSSTIFADFTELLLCVIDDRPLDVERSLTSPFGHSLGISATCWTGAGSGFLGTTFVAKAAEIDAGFDFASFHPKIEPALLPPPRTTRPLMRSSS